MIDYWIIGLNDDIKSPDELKGVTLLEYTEAEQTARFVVSDIMYSSIKDNWYIIGPKIDAIVGDDTLAMGPGVPGSYMSTEIVKAISKIIGKFLEVFVFNQDVKARLWIDGHLTIDYNSMEGLEIIIGDIFGLNYTDFVSKMNELMDTQIPISEKVVAANGT
jgi:hypothetical protein